MRWMQENNRDVLKEDINALVADFIKYQKQLKEQKKHKRQQVRKKAKKIKELEEKLKAWQSPKKIQEVDFSVRIGKMKGEVDVIIKNKIAEIKAEIERLQKVRKK